MKRFISLWENMNFVIEDEGSECGAYIFIEDNSGSYFEDRHYESIAGCMKHAYDLFGVPYNSWREIDK